MAGDGSKTGMCGIRCCARSTSTKPCTADHNDTAVAPGSKIGPQLLAGYSLHDEVGRQRKCGRARQHRDEVRIHRVGYRSEEHDLVHLAVFETERHVRPADGLQLVDDTIVSSGRGGQPFEHLADSAVAAMEEQLVLVDEMEVDRRGRHPDPLCYRSHRDGFGNALLDEQRLGGVEDLSPQLRTVSFAGTAPAHGSSNRGRSALRLLLALVQQRHPTSSGPCNTRSRQSVGTSGPPEVQGRGSSSRPTPLPSLSPSPAGLSAEPTSRNPPALRRRRRQSSRRSAPRVDRRDA